MIELAMMSSVCPDWDMKQIIIAMKQYGYKGFEPRVEWGHACGIELDMSSKSVSYTHLRAHETR